MASGVIIARVPLNAFSTTADSTAPPTQQPVAAAPAKPPARTVDPRPKQPAPPSAAKRVAPEQTAAVEQPAKQPVEQAAVLLEQLPEPAVSLDQAQQTLQDQAQLALQLVSRLPSVADLIPRASTPLEPDPAPPTEPPAPEAPATTPPREQPSAGDVAPTATATPIVLRNPPESGGVIRFLFDDQLHQLQPGEQLELSAEQSHRLRFHRGEDFGYADHQLSSGGNFEFIPTVEGWVLSNAE
jgi:hypothetical protein